MRDDDDELRRRIAEIAHGATVASATIARTAISSGPLSGAGEAVSDASALPVLTLAHEGAADLVELDTLGRGGMGRVVLALQRSLGRQVAVKTLLPDGTENERTALLREAFLTGALEHPAIVPVHALGVDAHGQPLLVMKRVEGVSWETLLAEPDHAAWITHLGDPADRLDAHVDILAAVCRALELAHARGIVHRDIKPANVMVGAFGEVYLVDWGLAAPFAEASGEQQIVGTPAFLAPEMVVGGEIDERTDVYLLGATLHAVLTGEARHAGTTITQVIQHATRSAPATYDASVPKPLSELANRACAREPERRPSSARAFREDIARWKRHRGAIELCAAARRRLDELRGDLAGAGTAPPTDLARAYRLAAEARFGFMQAAEQAPDLDDAPAGIDLAIETLVEIELRQDHAETAAALLADLRTSRPELLARVEEARRRHLVEAEERDRLRAVDRAQDPSFGRMARALPLLAIALTGALTAVVQLLAPVETSTKGALFVVTVVAVIAGAASIAMRRKIFGHAYNRRVWSVIVLTVGAIFVNRVTALAAGQDLVRCLAHDLVIIALSFAFGAVLVTPRLFVGTAVALACFVLAMIHPTWTLVLFRVAMVVPAVAGTWAIATSRRSS